MDFLHKGNTLVVTRIDRLARPVKDLQDIVGELKAKAVTLRRELKATGTKPVAIARELGVSRASVYLALKAQNAAERLVPAILRATKRNPHMPAPGRNPSERCLHYRIGHWLSFHACSIFETVRSGLRGDPVCSFA